MASADRPDSSSAEVMRAAAQVWETGYELLAEGWRQSQEFWNTVARGSGEMAGAWLGQAPADRSQETAARFRELQDAAFAVGQAWMRLPLALMMGTPSTELQGALTELTEAQARVYRMWTEALTTASGRTSTGAAGSGGQRG